MFCKNCGKENANGSKFCENCGAVLEVDTPENVVTDNVVYGENVNVNKAGKTNVCALIGFILSLVGFLCCGIVTEPAAVILGIVGKNQIKNTGEDGNGLATAAIIIGAIGTLLWIGTFAISLVAELFA